MADTCQLCNESSGSIRTGEFPDHMRTCQILTKASVSDWRKKLNKCREERLHLKRQYMTQDGRKYIETSLIVCTFYSAWSN
jgi:hypothetical protein